MILAVKSDLDCRTTGDLADVRAPADFPEPFPLPPSHQEPTDAVSILSHEPIDVRAFLDIQ